MASKRNHALFAIVSGLQSDGPKGDSFRVVTALLFWATIISKPKSKSDSDHPEITPPAATGPVSRPSDFRGKSFLKIARYNADKQRITEDTAD